MLLTRSEIIMNLVITSQMMKWMLLIRRLHLILKNLTAKAEEQEVKKLNLQHQPMHWKKRLEEHVRVGQKFRQKMNRRLLITWMKLTRLLIRLFRDRKKYHLMKQWMLPIKYRNRIYRNHQEEHVRKEMLKSLNLFRTVQRTLILNLSHWKQMHISMFRLMITMWWSIRVIRLTWSLMVLRLWR